MKRYYCTYFDRNYLVKALALIESLNANEKTPFHLFAVCQDELTRIVLEKLSPPNVSAIPMHEIEGGDVELLAAKQNRSLVEYYWTTTPTIILRLLETYPEIDSLTYLDADLFFFSSPDPIFAEFQDHSVLIHEHRFSPSMNHLEPFGKYNVGLLCFRKDRKGYQVLKWWRERCIEWCYMRFEDGKYGDQLYLNAFPTRFSGVKVIEHVGAGVAPWNHEQYEYDTGDAGNVLVNGRPVIFYHFHGLIFAHPELIIPAVHHHPLTGEILRLFHLPYIHSLDRGIEAVRSHISDFSFGLHTKDVLTSDHTFMVKSIHSAEIKSSGAPQTHFHLDGEWDCFRSAQLTTSSPLRKEIQRFNPTESKPNPLLELAQKEVARTPEQHAAVLNKNGEALYKDGAFEEALNTFTKAIELDPSMPAIHNNLGVMYWTAGDMQHALDCFETALSLDPHNRDTILNCTQLLQSHDRVEEAKTVCASYLKQNPNDTEISGMLMQMQEGE